MTFPSRKLILLVGIVLVLIAVTFSLKPPDLDSGDSQIGTDKSADLSDQTNSSLVRPSRRRTTGQSKSPRPTHEYAKLKDFIIPELKLEKSTFKQALNDLCDHYYDVCQLTGEKPIHFKFVIHGTPIDPHTITITNRSFLKNLNILALLGGMEMTRAENIITLTKIADQENLATHETKNIPVHPDFEKILAPNQRSNSPTDISTILRELTHSSQTECTYNASISVLTLSGNSHEIERMLRLIKNYTSTPVTQLRILTKTITIPQEALATINSNDTPLRQLNGKSEKAYSDGEAQILMRLLSQIQDSKILTSPTVLARPNEEGTIEIIREVIFPSAANEGKFTKDWTGFKITVNPSRLGFGSIPKLTYDRGVLNNQNNSNAPISITHLKDRIENYIPENKVTIAPIQSYEGKITYLWVALEEIDAAGVKIKRQ